LPAAHQVDCLLHITLNSSKTYHAHEVLEWLLGDSAIDFGLEGPRQRIAAAKQRFQQDLRQPRVLRELLQTAARREHDWAVRGAVQAACGTTAVD
jgi:hypothetical protein